MNEIKARDLREALAPVRPDPEDFKAGFERKLAERGERAEGGGDTEGGGAPVRTQLWRRAAAFLPLGTSGLAGARSGAFDLAESAILPGGVAAGVATKKLAATGGLLGVAALPAISLMMLGLAFASAVRSVLRAGADTGSSPDRGNGGRGDGDRGDGDRGDGGMTSAEVVRAWWRGHAIAAAASFATLAGLAWFQPNWIVLLVLLASMAAVTLIVVQLTRQGVATRSSIGSFTSGFLGALLGLALVFREFGEGVDAAGIPAYWVPTALFWGCLMCDVVERWRDRWTPLEKFAGAVLPTAVVVFFLALLGSGARPIPVEGLVRFVEDPQPPTDDLVYWHRLGHVGRLLSEPGSNHRAVDLSEVRAAVAASLGGGRSQTGVGAGPRDPFSLSEPAALDALPDELWAELAEEPDTLRLLESERSLISVRMVEARVHSLLRRGLDDGGRDRLALRIAATWPEPGEPDALQAMADLAGLADAIGRPLDTELGGERAASVHRALVEHWRGRTPAEYASAAFAAPFEPRPFHALSEPLNDVLTLPATYAAVELMQRFGVPDGIDLTRVRAYLERTATPSGIEVFAPSFFRMLTTQPYRYEASAALARFDRMDPEALAASTALYAEEAAALRAHALRTLAAALLLIALCLFATVWAGRLERSAPERISA